MSGGHFNYDQYKILAIVDTVESVLEQQGKLKDDVDLAYRREYYEKYPDDKYEPVYSEEIQQAMRDGVEVLKKAYVYAQRIDWFLSGDDGDENFLKRLKNDLSKL